MEENKLKRFDAESLPSFFKDLTPDQQSAYLDKLASETIELRRIAGEKAIKSKIAEGDMVADLEFLKSIDTENKVVSVKRNYETGSGNLELNIKGGDKKFFIPVMVVLGLILIAVLLIVFT